jgi:hypothetical protein
LYRAGISRPLHVTRILYQPQATPAYLGSERCSSASVTQVARITHTFSNSWAIPPPLAARQPDEYDQLEEGVTPMPYQLPADLEQRVRAQIESGQFATEDDVIREAIDTLENAGADFDRFGTWSAKLMNTSRPGESAHSTRPTPKPPSRNVSKRTESVTDVHSPTYGSQDYLSWKLS